jgi:hypothetical protein
MKFNYVKLNDGNYGAWAGSGLKRLETWYTGDSYGIGTANNDNIDTDYYIIWNEWPTFAGSAGSDSTEPVDGTVLANIGIDDLYFSRKDGAVSDAGLDCAIVRKSDRKAVRIQVSGTNVAHYTTTMAANATFTAIDPSDGPWSPEIGRLVNMGYIG